ncbi:carbohydrate-binding family 9-like protein [Parabacteroides chinchillae]|uniref:Carbohydrate family 9 binding domain-like n=1 Tax=Parabacteroides chinchillae TaxID=871327 RepID=A0A8G2BYB9_9BACT|nr:carbohydrate-binding family 9-like protein [Parabacteroides chinchillae]SEG17543.1 Carbohydrate family 9 binding domain-like [Parabacteroides chinchillae]
MIKHNLLAGFLLLVSCNQPASKDKEIEYKAMPAYNPPEYVCYKTPAPIQIDGKLTAGEWGSIPAISEFVDIEGSTRSAPKLKTEVKVAYDEQGMYIGAFLEEPHVWATITKHDSIIYLDNAFELFIEPGNNTHNYLEYEVNALGTEWDLFLTKPYRDGAQTLSNWETAGMKSAIHVDGTLNNPKDIDKSWSLEIFFPWSSIYQMTRGKEKPEAGDLLRMNFMRVQWPAVIKDNKYIKTGKGESYWIWAPMGIVSIHLPEYWGYIQLSDKVAGTGETPFVKDPAEGTKWLLRNLYYRQNEYATAFGNYASNIADLKPEEFCTTEQTRQITLSTTPSMYEISMPAPDGTVWHIRQDGFIWK